MDKLVSRDVVESKIKLGKSKDAYCTERPVVRKSSSHASSPPSPESEKALKVNGTVQSRFQLFK